MPYRSLATFFSRPSVRLPGSCSDEPVNVRPPPSGQLSDTSVVPLYVNVAARLCGSTIRVSTARFVPGSSSYTHLTWYLDVYVNVVPFCSSLPKSSGGLTYMPQSSSKKRGGSPEPYSTSTPSD